MPTSPSIPTAPPAGETSGPSTLWLGAGFLLAGLGTVLLGPILPTVSASWHLTDAQAGGLLFAKFLGAFAGGSTVPARLRVGVFTATLLTAAGLIAFSLASGLRSAAVALLLVGFGLGRLIASSNILAGRRYATHTGAALSTLNFFWSLGAVGTGLLTAWLLPRLHLSSLLLSVAGVFLLTGLGGASGWLFRPSAPASRATGEPQRLPRRTFLLFTTLLLLYGGLETTLSSWLPTLEQRYFRQSGLAQPHGTHLGHLLAGQSALVLFWAALTAGRMLAAAALRRWPETVVLRGGLAAAVVLIVGLAAARGNVPLPALSILLGLSLAPWFPAAFALLLHHHPTPREAGFILATSAIGAAIFPWLTGIVSTHIGSLRLAMGIPACLALLLLAASFLPQRYSASVSPEPL